MTTLRKALTVLALSGALLTTAAVPAQAAVSPTGAWKDCHTVYQVPQRIRIQACTDGTHRLLIWSGTGWRLIWNH